MRAYRFDDFKSLDSLRLHEEVMPEPQRGEILIRVRAISLNYRDLAMLLGRYVSEAKTGLIPTSDATGEVVAVGEGVDSFKAGDRVMGAFHPRWFGGQMPKTLESDGYGSQKDGWLVEYKAVSQETVIALPDSLSFEEGATIPCAALTAWTSLSGPMPIRAGHTVLTLGSGGVSIFALQLAKALGARVIATTSSPAKAKMLFALGADEVINYKEVTEWGERVRELTGGRGVDRVIEVGGPATINQSLRAVAAGGEIADIGFLSTENPGIDYFKLKATHASFRVIVVGDRQGLEDVTRAIATSRLKPVIDRVFKFEEIKEAFEHLKAAAFVGKIVVQMPGDTR